MSKPGRKTNAIKALEEAVTKTKAVDSDTAEYEKGLAAMKAQQ